MLLRVTESRNYLVASIQKGRSVEIGEVRDGIYAAKMPMPFRNDEHLPNDSSPWTSK